MDEISSKAVRKDIEHIKRSLASMDKTLALQHQSLEIHIKRTDLLEQKLEPIERHVQQVRGVSKFIGWLAAIAVAVAAFLALK